MSAALHTAHPLALLASANHHVGIGRERGFSFAAWLHGDRVANAWWQADYYFRTVKPPKPQQGSLL